MHMNGISFVFRAFLWRFGMVKVRCDKRDRSKYFETGYTVLFGLSKY